MVPGWKPSWGLLVWVSLGTLAATKTFLFGWLVILKCQWKCLWAFISVLSLRKNEWKDEWTEEYGKWNRIKFTVLVYLKKKVPGQTGLDHKVQRLVLEEVQCKNTVHLFSASVFASGPHPPTSCFLPTTAEFSWDRLCPLQKPSCQTSVCPRAHPKSLMFPEWMNVPFHILSRQSAEKTF